MNVQFFHARRLTPYGITIATKGGSTVALEQMEVDVFDKLCSDTEADLAGFHKVTLQIGKARCSDEDNYVKKIGRDMATARMKEVELTVVDITHDGDDRYLELQDDEGYQYNLTKYGKARRVYFEDYE